MIYVWLDVGKVIRDKRRIARARDLADDPGKLLIPNGAYCRAPIGGEMPHEILRNILEILAEEGLALKRTNSDG